MCVSISEFTVFVFFRFGRCMITPHGSYGREACLLMDRQYCGNPTHVLSKILFLMRLEFG